jgi:hypothetical protein
MRCDGTCTASEPAKFSDDENGESADVRQREGARVMAKFRKKPVVIEAFRWTADIDQTEDPEWIVSAIEDERVAFLRSGTPDVKLMIRTLEGNMTADVGDWIIKGVRGELYPCKPDIFAATYELVEEDE